MTKFVHQLVAMAKYYNFDGWFINIENDIEVGITIYHII